MSILFDKILGKVRDGAASLAAGSITLSKLADMASSSLYYRKSSGTGPPEVNTLATLKTDLGLTGTNTGDVVKASGAELDTGTDDDKFATAKAIKDSHNVPSVAPGTSGNVLTSNGTDWTSAALPPGGIGDMVLASEQSVTGLKTFDKDKIAMKGTSTGKTVISTANTSATDYTATLPAADGTILYTNGSAASLTDFPTLNQNTTGNAATATTLATARAIYGNNFDGSAALTQVIASTYGGTGNGFTKFSGPTTSEKTFTLPDENATLARTDAGQTFTGVNVFTSPKILTSIDDTNGNELLKLTATASAVNELTLANAATGGSPTLSATGGDTNIDLIIKAKGTGVTKIAERNLFVMVTGYATATAVGDGAVFFAIPPQLNGMNLVSVRAGVITAGTTNTTDIQIRNVTDGQDMLSTKITIDSTETTTDTAATAPVINTTYDDVATNDVIAIDIDAISTTPAKGLYVQLGFELP